MPFFREGIMRLATLLLMLIASPVYAENWVHIKGGVGGYDRDSIIHKGVFTDLTVIPDGPVRVDCDSRKVLLMTSLRTTQQGWQDIPHETLADGLYNAACSKWWEFWKR